MPKSIDHRLANRLKQFNPDLYGKVQDISDKHNLSVGEFVELAVLNYFMLEEESRYDFLRDLYKKIQDARARARKKAAEPLESDCGIPMTEPMLDLIEDANWPTEFEV